jgi:hypothetical protein
MEFKEYLEEWKQIGVVYHFTTEYHIEKMVDSELLSKYGLDKFEMISYNGVISLTRNPRLAENPLGDISKRNGFYVRINIDGSKLSNKYKIRPLRGLDTSVNPLCGDDILSKRVPKEWEENEEIVIPVSKNKTIKMKNYIKSITISGNKKIYEKIKDKVENIPIFYERKFTTLKEGKFFDNIDYCDLKLYL